MSKKSCVNSKDTWAKLFGYKVGDTIRLTKKVPKWGPPHSLKETIIRTFKRQYFPKGKVGRIYYASSPPNSWNKLAFYINFNPPYGTDAYAYCWVREGWIEIV